MMSYFKVGEECILQSKSLPHLNGGCTVIEVLGRETRRTYSAIDKYHFTYNHSYVLSIKNPNHYSWCESALRKKHKPSTESLSTVIEELNKVKA
jgi:hypothetical protein